jgi:hypothetical protein
MLKINFFTNFEICYEIINIFLIFFAAASTLNSRAAQGAHGYLSDAQKCAQCARTQIPCADSSASSSKLAERIIRSSLYYPAQRGYAQGDSQEYSKGSYSTEDSESTRLKIQD